MHRSISRHVERRRRQCREIISKRRKICCETPRKPTLRRGQVLLGGVRHKISIRRLPCATCENYHTARVQCNLSSTRPAWYQRTALLPQQRSAAVPSKCCNLVLFTAAVQNANQVQRFGHHVFYIRSSSLSSESWSSKYVFRFMVTLVFFSICELTCEAKNRRCQILIGHMLSTHTYCHWRMVAHAVRIHSTAPPRQF